ncbi:MAG: hypothetical protein HXX08_15905 [Chloroflexi bacterium]|uniref:Uncharacterized protein n=1 Tax=Candidatus Chlorohelix allophototropha TaxID=3003348 RepID=A0A8T7M5J3_9CHLR|nr:hypothetical protein [Chloroflexota bacterium]WJW69258.1 hypothetical protein OZ401_002861 [Chloroflexota bacterium L227-S17]
MTRKSVNERNQQVVTLLFHGRIEFFMNVGEEDAKMIKKLITYISLVLMIQLFLLSCSDATTTPLTAAQVTSPVNNPIANSPTATLTTLDLQKRILQGIPCKLPCWEGITPGITGFDEAVKILQSIPQVSNIKFETYSNDISSLNEPPKYEEIKVVTWDGKDNTGVGELLAYPTGNKLVRYITPNTNGDFLLKDVIKAYGEPQYIIASTQMEHLSGNGQSYGIKLIYPEKGFMLITGGLNPLILEDKLVFGMIIYDGKSLDNLRLMITIRDEWLQPWQGFKDYDYSCFHVGFLINDCGKLPAKAP